MRTLLLSLCAVALLAGCSDDKTESSATTPVVGDAQFAAAIDDLTTETRASLADGATTWEAGDQIGITAMIDGTPYVKNVPYKFLAATSFGELTAVDEEILWNESVAGERSFFACWPYKAEDDAFSEMDCARFNFEIPAEQQVTGGKNTAKPVLIGTATTSAQTRRPVALRFTNLFPVLNLHFDAFAETSISQIILEPEQDAELIGYLSAGGVITSTGKMTLSLSGQRISVTCDGEGLDISQGASVQIPIGRFTITGGLKFTTQTTDGRTFSATAFTDDAPFCSYVADAAGAFSKAKYINHTMALEVKSDEVADDKIYFQDDLDWIKNDSRWGSSMTGGGWPTVAAGASSATGQANRYTLDLIKPAYTDRYSACTNRLALQASYEGYVCIGRSSDQGALVTKPLAQIGDTPTDILVSFYGASYASENLNVDGKPLTVEVLNAGTVGDSDKTATEVNITNYYGWRKYWIIVKGATSATQIQFGQDVAKSVGRILLDNILIGKAVKGAVAGDREVNVTVTPYIKTLEFGGKFNYDIENAEGATGACIIQSNLPWTAATDADWVTVGPTVEYNGTGIAYAVTVTSKSLNTTGKARTAVVTFTAGELTEEVAFTQTAKIPEKVFFEDGFDWTVGEGTGSSNAPYGTAGNIFDNFPDVKVGALLGSNGTIIGSWPADWTAKGYTGSRAYSKYGCLTLGIAGNPGTITSPAFTAIGDTPTDVVVEFDILQYKNDTGKTSFSVAGTGEIASLTGNCTDVSGDTFTRIAADKLSYDFYCGNYGAWTSGAKWHHITVRITGATKVTQVSVSGVTSPSRFWIDNLKVSPKK